MNLSTWEETKGRIEGQERISRQHERFQHGFAVIQKRREEGITTEHETASGSKF